MRRLAVACALAGALLAGDARAAQARTRTHYTGQVNLNEATLAQLDLLPSVGTKAAQRILDWRKKRTFKRVEELVRIKGFGRKRFLRLKPYLAVQGETTLKAERVPAVTGPG